MNDAIVKRIALVLTLVALAWAIPLAYGEPALRSLPPMLSTVSDEVGVMTLAEGQTLAKTLADIEQQTGVQLIVVILAATAPENLERYLQRLINHWRHKSARLDHGRFVFVAVTRQERELRIVPSEKLAWLLQEVAQGALLTEVPALLKQDKYFEAMTAIANRLAQLIAERLPPARQRLVRATGHTTITLTATEIPG